MPDLVSTADYIDSACNRRQYHRWSKDVVMTASAGQEWSQWLAPGRPEAGAAPTTAAVPVSTTTGALARFTNPTSGETLRLLRMWAIAQNTTSALALYDRLSHMGGLSGNTTSLQTTNLPTAAITRGDTTGVGVDVFAECYTALGITSRTLQILYTNPAGTSGRTGTLVIPASMAASRVIRMTRQAGDLGVKSVESAQFLVGGTGTVGNFGLTLGRRIEALHVGMQGQNNVPNKKVGLVLGLCKIEPDACLWMILRSLAGGDGQHFGGLDLLASG